MAAAPPAYADDGSGLLPLLALTGDGAAGAAALDAGILLSPLAAYLAFKAAHLTLTAHADISLGVGAHLLQAACPPRWTRHWVPPTPLHTAFLSATVPHWGPRDDGAVACIAVDAATQVPYMTRGAVPTPLAPWLVAADVQWRAYHLGEASTLQGGVTLTLHVPLQWAPAAAPVRARVTNAATAEWRSGWRLAVGDGADAAVWRLGQPGVQLLHWMDTLPREAAAAGVGRACLRVRLAGSGAAAWLTLFPVRLPTSGMVACGWADGTLPQTLASAAAAAAAVAAHGADDTDTIVVLPWLPHLWATATSTSQPCMVGLSHPLRTDTAADGDYGSTDIATIVAAALRGRFALDTGDAQAPQARRGGPPGRPLQCDGDVLVLAADTLLCALVCDAEHNALAAMLTRARSVAGDAHLILPLPQRVTVWT